MKRNEIMYELTEQDKKEMKEAEEQIERENIEQYAKDQSVLESVKKQVSRELFETIEAQMEESEHYSNFRITDTMPEGKPQIEEGVNVWVDQHSVGDSGDSWAGTESVELPNGKYLTWDYWM